MLKQINIRRGGKYSQLNKRKVKNALHYSRFTFHLLEFDN